MVQGHGYIGHCHCPEDIPVMGLTAEPGKGACSPASDDRERTHPDTQKIEGKNPACTPPFP